MLTRSIFGTRLCPVLAAEVSVINAGIIASVLLKDSAEGLNWAAYECRAQERLPSQDANGFWAAPGSVIKNLDFGRPTVCTSHS